LSRRERRRRRRKRMKKKMKKKKKKKKIKKNYPGAKRCNNLNDYGTDCRNNFSW
jgi:hypothetical protein